MTAGGRIAVVAIVLLAAAAAGCGQTGPLVLPDSARPIEPAAGAEPERPDDEQQDER